MAKPGLKDHPKFRRARHQLDLPTPYLRGLLESLWEVGYRSGDPVIGDATDVELAAEWPGEPGKLFDALLNAGGPGKAGFIEPVPENPEQFQIHNLSRHAPKYVRGRSIKETELRKPKECEVCGSEFHSTDPAAKYCDDPCKQKAWRDRKKKSPKNVTARDDASSNAGNGPKNRYRVTARYSSYSTSQRDSAVALSNDAGGPAAAAPPPEHEIHRQRQHDLDRADAIAPEILAELKAAVIEAVVDPERRRVLEGRPATSPALLPDILARHESLQGKKSE